MAVHAISCTYIVYIYIYIYATSEHSVRERGKHIAGKPVGLLQLVSTVMKRYIVVLALFAVLAIGSKYTSYIAITACIELTTII